MNIQSVINFVRMLPLVPDEKDNIIRALKDAAAKLPPPLTEAEEKTRDADLAAREASVKAAASAKAAREAEIAQKEAERDKKLAEEDAKAAAKAADDAAKAKQDADAKAKEADAKAKQGAEASKRPGPKEGDPETEAKIRAQQQEKSGSLSGTTTSA
jgi:hypothetical protein